MTIPLRILIVEDNPDDAELMILHLTEAGFHLVWQRVETEADYLAALELSPELILSDWRLPQFDGLRALQLLGARSLSIPFIIFSGSIGEEAAIETLRNGADDYVLKDRPARLGQSVRRALEDKRLRQERQQAEKALRESEARLAGVVNSAMDAIISVDSDQRIIVFNPAAEQMFKCRASQALGQRIERFIPHHYHSVHEGHITRFGLSGVTNRAMGTPDSIYGLRWNGEEFPIEASISHIEAGGQHLYTVILRDITERQQAAETLHRRVAELEALYTLSAALRTAQTRDQALPILLHETLAALDTDAGAIWLYHADNGELHSAVDRGWFAHVDKRRLTTDERITSKVFTTGQLYLCAEFRTDPLVSPAVQEQAPPGWGGTLVPIHAGADTIGVLTISMPSTRHITPEQITLLKSLAEMVGATLHRLQLWQETQEQAHRVQGIMDTAPMGILLLDGDGRILLANPVAERDLVVLSGAKVGDLLTTLDNLPLAQLLVPPTHGSWHEVKAQERTFEMIARPMVHEDEVRRWVLVINDVSAEREQQRYQQAQERLATVGQLAAGIAHDFNNILGVILLYVGLLRTSRNLSDPQRSKLDVIHDQVQHAANLIRQILDFSRQSVLQIVPLNLLQVISDLVALLERTLPENIHLELTHDRSEYIVCADPTRLQQALMNLALNARDAMPDGGRLSFTCSTLDLAPDQPLPLPDMDAGKWLCLTVADTGTGIAPEHLTHIFEPFFTTKEPGKGTGLGLAQVYGVVGQHGGYINLESQLGEGTTFSIYLPILAAVTERIPVRELTDIPQNHNEMILVVEDNILLRTSLRELLEQWGYRVQEAAHGLEALARLAEPGVSVDLVLSDVVMPKMGGVALVNALHQQSHGLPVILMSGHSLQLELAELSTRGVRALLAKPLQFDQLAQALAQALRTKSGSY